MWFSWPPPGWGIGVVPYGVGVLFYVKWRSPVSRIEERELRQLQGSERPSLQE